eukprot:s1116_g1.t1
MNGVYISNSQEYMPGGFVVGSYVYLIPNGNGQQDARRGAVYRITESTFTYPATYTLSHSVMDVGWGFTDGTYGYMAPGTSGHLGRFNLDLFSMDPSTYVDLTQIDSDIGAFHGGFHDGTYGYLVPHFETWWQLGDKTNLREFMGDSSLGSSGKVVRFDLATFSTFEVLDVSDNGMYTERRKFIDGFTDFEHGFLVPMGTDSRTFVRFSLKDFTLTGVDAVDLTSVSSSGTFKAGVCAAFGNVSHTRNGWRFSNLKLMSEKSLLSHSLVSDSNSWSNQEGDLKSTTEWAMGM